jgi:NAD-dependent DNA ligase
MVHPENCPECNSACETAYDEYYEEVGEEKTQYRCDNDACSVEVYETDTKSPVEKLILEQSD